MDDAAMLHKSGVKIEKLAQHCGAMISGVDLTQPLSADQIKIIQQAWDDHLVLVFRGQTLSEDDQLRFASYFGEPGNRKIAPDYLRPRADGILQNNPKFMLVSNIKVDGQPIGSFGDGDMWFHIDSGYSARPYKYTFLYGLKLPDTGGNTMFSNTYAAYEAVPEDLKAKLEGRKALHIHEYKRNERVELAGDISQAPHWYHPVFIRHPNTGKKALFVDRLMTRAIAGMEPEESEAVLDQLYDIGERREFIYEHVWQLGDFVMWDNLATIHARTWFPPEQERLLRRCTIEGVEVSG